MNYVVVLVTLIPQNRKWDNQVFVGMDNSSYSLFSPPGVGCFSPGGWGRMEGGVFAVNY